MGMMNERRNTNEAKLKPIKIGGEVSTYTIDTTYMAVRGLSDEARAEISAIDRRIAGARTHPSFFRPIGMEDKKL